MDLQNQFPQFVADYCYELNNSVEALNSETDIQLFISKNKTNVNNPKEIEYAPYDPANPDFKTSRTNKQGGGALNTSAPASPAPTLERAQSFVPVTMDAPVKDSSPSELYPGLSDDQRNLPVEEKKMGKVKEELSKLDLSPAFPVNEKLNRKVVLYRGDICKLEVDAIQNAANKRLGPGGGINGAIGLFSNNFCQVKTQMFANREGSKHQNL